MEDIFMPEAERCAAVLQAALPETGQKMTGNAHRLVDLWEKSQFVVRLIDTIVTFDDHDRLPADPAMPDPEDLEGNVDIAFCHLMLGIALALNHQPERENEYLGHFKDLVFMERDYFPSEVGGGGLPARWPASFHGQYRLARDYTIKGDLLSERLEGGISDLSRYADRLLSAFEQHYVFPGDDDEYYRQYVQLFCQLTLGFTGHCLDFCRAMAALMGEDVAKRGATKGEVAATILHARAIAAFGLKVDYRRWVDDMENRT